MTCSSSKLSKLALLLALLVACTLIPSTPASTQTGFWVPASTSCVPECATFHPDTPNAVVTGTYKGTQKKLSVCAAWDKNKKGFRAGVSYEGEDECAIAAGGTTFRVKSGYLCLCMKDVVPGDPSQVFQVPWIGSRGDDCVKACQMYHPFGSPSPVPFAVLTGTYHGGSDNGMKLSVCGAWDKNKKGFRAGVSTEKKNECAIAAGGTTYKVKDETVSGGTKYYGCMCTETQIPF